MSDPDRYGRVVQTKRRELWAPITMHDLDFLRHSDVAEHRKEADACNAIAAAVISAARAEIIAEWIAESGVEEMLQVIGYVSQQFDGRDLCPDRDLCPYCGRSTGLHEANCKLRALLARIKAAKEAV